MRRYFACAVVFCAANSFWAVAVGMEGWCAFWGFLAVVNSISYRVQTRKETKLEPQHG